MVALQNVKQFQTKAGKAIEDFLHEKAKRSERTAISYRSDINKFLNDIFEKSINTVTVEELELLDYESFNSFLNSLHGKLANGSINRQASSVESLYRFLIATKVIKTDLTFFSLIKSLPSTPNSYEVMPMEVMFEYLEEAKREKHKPKEKFWAIKLAIEIGLRDSEIRHLKWSQFKPDGSIVYVIGYGKGNKKYTEPISRDIYNELVADLKVEGQKEVFTITKKNVTDMMMRFRKKLNYLDRNYVFHSLRKTSVNFAYKLTGNLRIAQAKARHSKPETTQLYLEEEQSIMTGYFSLERNLNHNLFKEVDHNILINTLECMPKELLFLLNLKLNEKNL